MLPPKLPPKGRRSASGAGRRAAAWAGGRCEGASRRSGRRRSTACFEYLHIARKELWKRLLPVLGRHLRRSLLGLADIGSDLHQVVKVSRHRGHILRGPWSLYRSVVPQVANGVNEVAADWDLTRADSPSAIALPADRSYPASIWNAGMNLYSCAIRTVVGSSVCLVQCQLMQCFAF